MGFSQNYEAQVSFALSHNDAIEDMVIEQALATVNESRNRLASLRDLVRAEEAILEDRWRHYYRIAKSPIRRLPAEALMQIFVEYSMDEPIPLPWYFDLSPTVILHVCSKWRHLALGDPRFWCNLLVELDLNNAHFADMMQETLVRAQGRSFKLHIRGKRFPPWLDAMVDGLASVAHRILVFSIEWNKLQELPLQLRSLYLFPANLIEASLEQLTRLTLDGVHLDVPNLFALISRCHSLEELDYLPSSKEPVHGRTTSYPPRTPWNFPQLIKLTIRIHPSWTLSPLEVLHHLTAPGLIRLALISIDRWGSTRLSWDNSVDQRIGNFTHLKSLRIDLSNISWASIDHVLSGCMEIEELIVPWPQTSLTTNPNPFIKSKMVANMYGTRLTRFLFNPGDKIELCLRMLELRGATTARNKYRLRDVTIVWDQNDSESGESLITEEILARVERLCEGGMETKFKRWGDVDFEVDLRLHYK